MALFQTLDEMSLGEYIDLDNNASKWEQDARCNECAI